MYVLIVEHDYTRADLLHDLMCRQHYTADIVYNGEDGLTYGESNLYDIILMNISQPHMDGYEVTRKLRDKKIQTPIILLGEKCETSDIVYGFDCGADDVISIPYSKDELLARIRARSRRHGGILFNEIVCGDLKLNLSERELSCGDQKIRLGYKEFEIFKILSVSPGKVVPKNELLVKVWGFLTDAEENNVEVYISFLRKKIASLHSRVTIEVLRKIGYRIAIGDDTRSS